MTLENSDIIEYLYKHKFISTAEDLVSTTCVYSCLKCGMTASYPVILDQRSGYIVGLVSRIPNNKVGFSMWLRVPCPGCGEYANPTMNIPLATK